MAKPTVPTKILSNKVRQRIRRCGTTVLGRTGQGVVKDVQLTCGHRACQFCARKYSQRIFRAMAETFEAAGLDDPWMLTLTPGKYKNGLGEKALADNSRNMSQWLSDALDLARDIVRRWRKVREWEREAEATNDGSRRRLAKSKRKYHRKRLAELGSDLRPRPEKEEYEREFCSQWRDDDGERPPKVEHLDYVWAREVTTGQYGTHWHVHFHMMLRSEKVAQLINACWQEVVPEDREDFYWRTSIDPSPVHDEGDADDGDDEDDGGRSDAAEAASYLCHYVTKGRTPKNGRVAKAQLDGLENHRMYDAGGRFRPLGVAKDTPVNPVQLLSTPTLADEGYWEPWEDYHSKDSIVRGQVQRIAELQRLTQEWGDLDAEARAAAAAEAGGAAQRRAARYRRAAAMLDTGRNFSETPQPSGGGERPEKSGACAHKSRGDP